MSDWRPDPDAIEMVDADTTLAPPVLRLASDHELGATRRSHGRLPRGRVRALLAVDVISVGLALAGTFLLAEAIGPPAVIAPAWLLVVLVPLVAAGWLALFTVYGLYEGETRAIAPNSFDEVSTLFNALLAGSLALLVAGQGVEKFTDLFLYSPLEAVMFLGLALVLVPSLRGAVRTWLVPHVMRPRRALIVGAGPSGQALQRKIESHPEYGLELVGYVDDDPAADVPLVGRTHDLTRLVENLEIDWVVLAASSTPYEETLELVRAVRRPDVHLSIVPNYFELFASNATIEDLEGIPVVSLPTMRFSRSVRALKRSVDILASGIGLALLSPLLAVVALAIKLDSPGPVFFRQRRQGRGGREFRIVKFRTMVADAEQRRFDLADLNDMESAGPLFKIKDDPRITRIGRFLRKSSIDELPQLWNVLRGEMSLVGPRPFVVHESEQITGWAGRRLETTPGITGLWQVLGRNDIPYEEMVKLDYIYVTNWSLWWDVKILCQTIPVVFGRRGY